MGPSLVRLQAEEDDDDGTATSRVQQPVDPDHALVLRLLDDEKRVPLLLGGGACSSSASSDNNNNEYRKLYRSNGRGSEKAEEKQVRPWLMNMVSWEEMGKQCFLAGPLILGILLSFGLQLASVIIVGHTGELELAAASLANSLAVVSGYSVLIGLNNAMETLCGQAYGAGEHRKLGIYMQRSIFVLLVASIPLTFVWVFMEQILLGLGQDARIARKAGLYGKWLIPTLYATSFYQPLIKFLQAQSIVTPLFAAFVATLICHVPISWALVYKSSLGFSGAALANSISFWFSVLLLACYVWLSPSCAQCRPQWSLELLRDLKSFLKLAIPSASMICLEWWCFEILVVLSGLLSNPELQTATMSVCVSSESMLYMIPYGLAASISTRVSNELGAGRPLAAQRAVWNAVVLALSEALFVAACLLLLRGVWGRIYSSVEEVVNEVNSLAPLLAASVAFDSLQAVLAGVLRGAGWQDIGALLNLGAFYMAGLPAGCLLAFVAHWEGKGLWMGLVIGVMIQACAFATLTYFTDWQNEVIKATARVKGEEPLLVGEEEPVLACNDA